MSAFIINERLILSPPYIFSWYWEYANKKKRVIYWRISTIIKIRLYDYHHLKILATTARHSIWILFHFSIHLVIKSCLRQKKWRWMRKLYFWAIISFASLRLSVRRLLGQFLTYFLISHQVSSHTTVISLVRTWFQLKILQLKLKSN